MASPNIQDWFYVELTLKKIEDGSTTTYKLSTRPVIDDSTHYYPLLLNISGVGSRMSDYLPYSSSGQLTIDNSEGSFGYERKFSDLFERYAIVNQSVKVYAAQTEYDDLNVTSDFSLAYTATATEWSIDNTNKTLNISIAGSQIKPRVVTKTIDATTFPSAPSGSIGKALPLVFGTSQEVPAIRVDADGDTSPSYVYATTLSTTFPVGGVQTYYAKEKITGKFKPVGFSTTASTPIYTSTNNSGGSYGTGSGIKEIAIPLSTIGLTTPVFTAVRVQYQGTGSGGWTPGSESKFVYRIYQASTLSGVPEVQIGYADRLKSNYTANIRASTGTDFYVEAAFTDAIVIAEGYNYLLGISQTIDSTANAGAGDQVFLTTDSVATTTVYYKSSTSGTSDNVDTWLKQTGALKFLAFDLYACQATETKSSAADSDGLGYASFELTQHTGIGSDYGTPDLTKLDFVVSINGIKDDSSGTITGVANTQLTQPKHVAALLEREWNGSAWVAGNFDFTQYSSTHNTNVTVRGATNGRTTYEQVLSDLCRNTASRVAAYNGASKQLGFYQWGVTIGTSAVITDEDAEILNVEERGIETVVNRFTFYYDRRYRDLDITAGSAQGEFKNYAGTLDWYSSKDYLTSYYSATSYSLYGTRPAAAAAYDYFADSSSAAFIAKYLAGKNAFPARYVELEVPFFKYRTLELLNVIEILHPALPAFFGSSANAKPPTYTGSDVDLIGGHYWKRAQRYRAQIESKEMIFNPGGISKLRLGCRLLLNSPKDPT